MKELVGVRAFYPSVRQWLSRARGIQARIASLQESMERAYLRATSSTLPLRPTGGGHKGSSGYDANAAYVALSTEVERQEAQLAQACAEILYVVSQIENNTLSVLLLERYINEKSLREIALIFDCSVSRVYQLHQKAVAEVQKILDGNVSLEPSA